MVVACTIVSVVLGLYDLSTRSLWLDEGFTWLYAAQSSSVVWQVAHVSGGHLFAY
jgi:hypothetical protein